MRPTDENQAASTRPNLMSSRRAAGEENILAMLERDSTRRAGGRISSPRLAWYCAAAAFAGILVGVVAWLAYDNHTTATALQAQVEPVEENTAPASAPPLPPEPAPLQLAEAPQPGVIVDQPQDRPATPPPLVMLPPEDAGTARPPAPAAQAEAPKKEAAAMPKPASASVPASAVKKPEKIDKADTTRLSGKTAKADKAVKMEKVKKAEKAPRPSPRAAKPPAPRGAVAKADGSRRKTAPGTASDAAVDSDVALISAIIAQSERHRGEREQAAPCTGTKCPAPPSRR